MSEKPTKTEGISIRYVKEYDIVPDVTPSRIDWRIWNGEVRVFINNVLQPKAEK